MELFTSKKRILVLGDSLCLPRKQPEQVSLFQTWPYLLKNNKQFEVVQLAIGSGTIQNLYEQSTYYAASKPDIVILQSGIVDCAPRALGRIEKEIINGNRLLRFLFYRFLPIKLMRRLRNKTYTKATDFQSLIIKMANRFSNSQIIWIGIIPANCEYEKLVPGVSKNIEKYNKMIAKEIINHRGIFLNVSSIPKDGIMSDYHHLTSIGHKWIFQQISVLISTKDK